MEICERRTTTTKWKCSVYTLIHRFPWPIPEVLHSSSVCLLYGRYLTQKYGGCAIYFFMDTKTSHQKRCYAPKKNWDMYRRIFHWWNDCQSKKKEILSRIYLTSNDVYIVSVTNLSILGVALIIPSEKQMCLLLKLLSSRNTATVEKVSEMTPIC